jgi:predicted nucleic acid-binding Zn ribbon protein
VYVATEEERTDAAAQAKAAMDRAKAGARVRGVARKPAGAAAREKRQGRAGAPVDPTPYGKGRDPRPVGGEIASVFEHLGWTERIEVASVATRWRDVVGDEIADHCEILSFDGGVLVLQATTTAWAEGLGLLAGQIAQRLNEDVGRVVVTSVRVEKPIGRSWVKGQRTVKGRGPRDTYG